MAVEKADLEKMEERLKEHMDLALKPVIEDVKRNRNALFGHRGTNGIVRAVNWLYMVATSLVLGMGILFNKVFNQ